MRIWFYARPHRRGTFMVFCLAALASGITCTPQQSRAAGPQFDAPFLDFQKQNAEQWAAEDQQIDQKLAALQKRKPSRAISSS